MSRMSRRAVAPLAALLFGLMATPAAGQEASISEEQARAALKVLAYDRNLKARVDGQIDLAIIYKPDNGPSVTANEALTAAFTAAAEDGVQGLPVSVMSLPFTAIHPLQNRIALTGIDTLVLAPGLFEAITDLISMADLLDICTITTVRNYVQLGAAVGVLASGDEVNLIVNLAGSQRQGMDISAQVLRLAEVLGVDDKPTPTPTPVAEPTPEKTP